MSTTSAELSDLSIDDLDLEIEDLEERANPVEAAAETDVHGICVCSTSCKCTSCSCVGWL